MRNPLSPKRKDLLKKRYAKQPDIDQVLDWAAQADPTRSGEYVHWMLHVYLHKSIRLPEDIEKLRDKLTEYHKLKQRIPAEEVQYRDINTFETYAELARAVDKYSKIKTRRELTASAEMEGAQLIATLEKDMTGSKDQLQFPFFTYTLVRVTTPEAAMKLAQGTEWCVKYPDQAKWHLEKGWLYFIDLNGKRFALAHAQTAQVNDIFDESISPDVQEDLIELFREHLPKLICKRHEDRLVIDACDNCDARIMCYKCFSRCQGKNGEERCKAVVCPACQVKCACGSILCNQHVQECLKCGTLTCKNCLNSCVSEDHNKQGRVCDTCAKFLRCTRCSNIYCSNDTLGSCSTCSSILCVDCNTFCLECQETFCGSHIESCEASQRGRDCTNGVCEKCIKSCDLCRKDLCYDCYNECATCSNNFICNDCTGTSTACKDCQKKAAAKRKPKKRKRP